MKPAVPYNTNTASLKAKALHPGAFCKVARDSPRAHRFQVLVEVRDDACTDHECKPDVYLCASGRSWVEALEQFFKFMEEVNGQEEARREAGRSEDGRDGGAGVDGSPLQAE